MLVIGCAHTVVRGRNSLMTPSLHLQLSTEIFHGGWFYFHLGSLVYFHSLHTNSGGRWSPLSLFLTINLQVHYASVSSLGMDLCLHLTPYGYH